MIKVQGFYLTVNNIQEIYFAGSDNTRMYVIWYNPTYEGQDSDIYELSEQERDEVVTQLEALLPK